MATNRKLKGVQGIQTTRALLDARRLKSASGALMELAALATERQRLQAEVDRWVARQAEIQARLGEIVRREARLQVIVQEHMERTTSLGDTVLGSVPAAPAGPIPFAEPVRGVATRELNY